MEKETGIVGLLVIAAIGSCIALISLLKKDREPLLTREEYHTERASAAETGGIDAVTKFREETLGVIGEFATEHFEWEHNKMLAAIANRDYSGCVLCYKASHKIPADGWGNEPYNFCADAITNIGDHLSPTVVEIIEQGGTIARAGDELPSSETVVPDAYRWILANTECTSINSEHYQDYEQGYRDAMLQGYYPTVREGGWRDPQIVAKTFYDKVMEFAGKKEVGVLYGAFTAAKRGEWVW